MKNMLKSLIIAVLLAGMLGGSLLAVNNMIVNVPAANRNLEIRNVVRDTDGNELIDIDEDELFTGSSYQELMSAKQADNKLYLLARVLSKDDKNQLNVHYYDAHALNHWFFKNFEVPFKTLDQYKSPASNAPVVAIDYFTIKPMTNDQVFNHLCSFDTLVGNSETWINYFHTNQPPEVSVLSAEEKFERSMNFFYGREGFTQDYITARTYLEQILETPEDDPRVTAEARFSLGQIYYFGMGVPQNYATARSYFEQVLEIPEENPVATTKAKFALGRIYYFGRGVPKNYTSALSYFKQVLENPAHDPVATTEASVYLGKIYYFGHGVAQNYPTARTYFEQVIANPQAEPKATAEARFGLGTIYYLGRGVTQNYTLARSYFEQVLENPHDNETLKELAQEFLDTLPPKTRHDEIQMRLLAIVQEKKDIKKSNVSQEEKNTQLEVLRAEERRLKAECGNKSSCTVQ